MRLTPVRLHEVAELEPRVIERINDIEEGFRVLQNQLPLGDPGRPDIVAADSEGALTVIELKAETASPAALAQVLRYRDSLSDKRALLARLHHEIDPNQPVRVVIAAPDFDEDLRRVAKYLSIDVGLVRVTPVRDEETGAIDVMLALEEVEQVAGDDLTVRTAQEITDYLADPVVRPELDRVLAELQALGVQMQPWQTGKRRWLECAFRGIEVAYIGCRQKYFRTQHWDRESGTWAKPVTCTRYAEWAEHSKPHVLVHIQAIRDGA